MRHRMVVTCVIAASVALLGSPIAHAQDAGQEDDEVTVADLFSWYSSDDPQWSTGGFYAALGLVGAIFVAFGLIGGAVPGTAGQANIERDEARVERMNKQLESLISGSNTDPARLAATEAAVDRWRDDVRSERWRQYTVACILYAILGAFFASMLAKDILQALVIGAGWTGVLGSLGLRSDYAQRKSTKDDALERVVEQLKIQTLQPAQTKPPTEVEEAVFQADVALSV